MTVPCIDALYWIPEWECPPEILSRVSIASAFDDGEVIEAFERRDDMVGLPRHFAFRHFKPSEVTWQVARGQPIEVPACPKPRSEQQAAFWGDVLAQVKGNLDTVAAAATGSGKTVAACHVLAHLKRTMLVVVHKGALATQWKAELMRHCGLADHEVGLVGDGERDWEGKKAVVALLQTLRMDGMPDAFWDHFGIAVLDEAHTVPAAKSSLVMRRVKAARRLALTATPKRRDGLDEVLGVHLGPVKVTARMAALPMRVNVLCYDNPEPRDGWPVVRRENAFGQMEVDRMATRSLCIKILERDPARFKISLDLVVKAHAAGRRGLVTAEGIEHLERLRDAVVAAGVPAEDVGLFTAQATLPVKVWEHEDVEISPRRRVQRAKREGVPLSQVPTHESKRTDRFTVEHRRVAQKREDLDAMLRTKRILFATPNMVKEGVDVPAWDYLHDVIPRSEAVQLIGRIRREHPDKKTPLQHTFHDRGCPAMEPNFRSRLNDYFTSGNVTVTQYERRDGKWAVT